MMTALPTTPTPRRAAHEASRPALTVVAPPRHTFRYLLVIVLVAAASVFGIVSLSALAAEQAFAARALEGEIADLTHRYEELTAEVAALEAPARVRRVATEELGMVPAAQPAFLVIDAGPRVVPAQHDGGDEGAAALADPLKPALSASH